MTDNNGDGGDPRPAFVRALLAAALVAAGHVGAFAWLTSHSLSTDPPDSVLGAPIELDLLAVAPPAPPQEIAAPAPQPTQEPPPPTPEPAPTQPPPDPSPPPPQMQEPPAPEPTPDLPTPTPTVTPPPDAVILPSPPPPRPPKTPRPKPTPTKPDPEKVERDRQRAEAKERARDDRRQQRADAARTRDDARPAAAQRPVSSGADISTWRGEVMARIGEFKPASTGASGTTLVAFSVDGGGRVVSASVVRSSGHASLDAASVAMVRRASPVPAPPAGLGGHVNLTVPVNFQ